MTGDRMLTSALILLLVTAPLLAGCIGDQGEDLGEQSLDDTTPANATPSWARPLPEEITGLEQVTGEVADVEAGGGLWTEGDLAYVSGQNTGFYIVNLSTPDQPTVLSSIKDQFSRDVDLLHYEDRTVAVLAASGSGMVFVDVTEPERPERIATLEDVGNVHNVAVVPGTHTVYNSRSVDTPGVDIVDASDPANPEVVQVFGDVTCHDVTFWTEGDRAYCPGVRETQIWDISDPQEPSVVTRIHNPAINIHHWALPLHNGTLLAIGDEFAGSTDAAAGCLATEDIPGVPGTQSDPVGAVWLYDISDESTPIPLGYVSAELPTDNVPPTPCTAHFGEQVGDRDMLVVGWRAAGTYLVDISDPAAPSIVDTLPTSGDIWEARYHHGYVFTGDTDGGMSVLTFSGE